MHVFCCPVSGGTKEKQTYAFENKLVRYHLQGVVKTIRRRPCRGSPPTARRVAVALPGHSLLKQYGSPSRVPYGSYFSRVLFCEHKDASPFLWVLLSARICGVGGRIPARFLILIHKLGARIVLVGPVTQL